jgi:DNA-binding GntR family transcriptional regulator
LIVWGKLAPGSRIIETDIAARLGVSRTPVRAALQRLLQEGYIQGSGNGGQQSRLSVSPLTRDDARELFTIVSEVEALAARWAAEKPAEHRGAVAERLRETNARLRETGERREPDTHALFDLDQAFHFGFMEAGAGPRLMALHSAVRPQSERYVRLYLTAFTDEIHHSVSEHEAIIEAIEAGRPLDAKEAVLQNWRNAGERLSAVIDRLGERGNW